MPIIERNPAAAFRRFEQHIEPMVRSVLPLPPPVQLLLKTTHDRGVLELTKGGVGTSVPVETNLGTLHLSLNQDLVAIKEGRSYRLRTHRYQYKLLPTNDAQAEAIIRWEFDAGTADDAECRNHLHINASLPVGHGTLRLVRAHVPTAWVLIEHVLRFLFHDLAVPALTTDWPVILRKSETDFYEKFTSRRYRFRS